jgi:hypothetical protein
VRLSYVIGSLQLVADATSNRVNTLDQSDVQARCWCGGSAEPHATVRTQGSCVRVVVVIVGALAAEVMRQPFLSRYVLLFD